MPLSENWRPKLRRIDDPIADDHWEYTTPRGQQRIARLTVGRPVHYPEQKLWYCPVRIEGHTRPSVKPIFGMGPVDSLMNAMTFVRKFFEENFEVLPGVKSKQAKRVRSSARAKKATLRKRNRKPATAGGV